MRIAGILALALTLGAVAPAWAEFFNCNQRPGQLLYSYNGSLGDYGRQTYSRRYTNEFAAQSTRRSYQHAAYFGARHYWNDRTRW